MEKKMEIERMLQEVSSFTGLIAFLFFSSLKSLIPQCKAENKSFCQTCFPNYILENGKTSFKMKKSQRKSETKEHKPEATLL